MKSKKPTALEIAQERKVMSLVEAIRDLVGLVTAGMEHTSAKMIHERYKMFLQSLGEEL